MSISAEVATLFVEELANRDIPVEIGDDGVYQIELGDEVLSVSLENLSKDFETDRDPQRVIDFIDTITQPVTIPDWDDARDRIRWALEPSDMPLDEALHELISDQVARVLVYVTPDESRLVWITEETAERWGLAKESLEIVANENMQGLLASAEVEFETIDDAKLGMLNTNFSAFKASLVFTPGFKEIVEPALGWPVFALVPCRDFVFLIPETDRDLLDRAGGVVVKEYLESAYPLCTEVFELNDEGIQAIGEFDKSPPPELDDDGMKTIHYLDGTVNFRLPGHWVEEYDEETGGTFYDEDVEAGTLRVSTITAESKTPVTTESSRKIADDWVRDEKGILSDLGEGIWLVQYDRDSEEEGEPLTMRYWQIVTPIPPNYVLIVIFSYSVFTKDLASEDVVFELAMLDREVRECTFAS